MTLQPCCVPEADACSFPSGANIFLTSSGLIKLGDFGCSVKLKNNAQTMPGEVNSTLGTAGRMGAGGQALSQAPACGPAEGALTMPCRGPPLPEPLSSWEVTVSFSFPRELLMLVTLGWAQLF